MTSNSLDIIKIQDHHKKKAKLIYPKIKDRKVITIGGMSGTGKTEIAYCLQTLFLKERIRYQVVSEDNFYITPWRNRNKIRKQSKVIGLVEISWEDLVTVVGVYKRLPSYDGVIVEGLYANYLQNKDYGIYLEATIKQTESFRKMRRKEAITEYRQEILIREAKDVRMTKSLADLIIPWR